MKLLSVFPFDETRLLYHCVFNEHCSVIVGTFDKKTYTHFNYKKILLLLLYRSYGDKTYYSFIDSG